MPEQARMAVSSAFTPVNAGGFTAVNAQPPPPPPAPATNPGSFATVNAHNGFHLNSVESQNSTPLRNGGSPMLSAHNTPDLRPFAVGLTSLSNGHAFNQLKRTMSQETESGQDGDVDSANGRRSKRAKKGKQIPCQCSFPPVVKTGLRNPCPDPGTIV
jgi:histone demethylase JARID1